MVLFIRWYGYPPSLYCLSLLDCGGLATIYVNVTDEQIETESQTFALAMNANG